MNLSRVLGTTKIVFSHSGSVVVVLRDEGHSLSNCGQTYDENLAFFVLNYTASGPIPKFFLWSDSDPALWGLVDLY